MNDAIISYICVCVYINGHTLLKERRPSYKCTSQYNVEKLVYDEQQNHIVSILLQCSSNASEVMTAPVVGAVSVAGRSRAMEDALCIRPNLCRPEINRRHPLHYFAVFDGHGGAHVNITLENVFLKNYFFLTLMHM